jgi:hypothetical protein
VYRITAAAAVSLASLVALAGGASASHEEGGGQGTTPDFAIGTGMNEIGRVSFAAHGGPPPLPVRGHFHAKGVFPGTGEFDLEGPVTCLTVVENPTGPDEAGLFYPVRDPDLNEPQGVFIFLRDNGDPAGGDQPDQIGFIPTTITQTLTCPPTPLNVADLDRGNITIHAGA